MESDPLYAPHPDRDEFLAEDSRDGRRVKMRAYPITYSQLTSNDLIQMVSMYQSLMASKTMWQTLEFFLDRSNHTLWAVKETDDEFQLTHIALATEFTPLKRTEIDFIARSFLQGLAHLHSHGHVHRMLRSESGVVFRSGAVKLADPGEHAFPEDAAYNQASSIFWKAPETLNSDTYSPASDIWAFGMLLHELVEGNPMFSNRAPSHAMFQIKSRPLPTVAQISKWDPELLHIFEECTNFDAAKRPSAEQLLSLYFSRGDEADLKKEMAGLAEKTIAGFAPYKRPENRS
jgi:serine/threonine protein kinase